MQFFLCLTLAASTAGMILLVRRAFRLPAAFCPAVALGCQVLWLYAAALLGLLRAGVFALTALGLAALVWCLLRDRSLFREMLSPGPVFFLLLTALFAVTGRDLVPTGYDNFTHWAVIVKELYRTDALPAAGTLVQFTNYPPATALYEYFVVQFTGFREGYMVLALNILGSAMAACCLADTRWSAWRSLLARTAVTAGALLVVPEHFRNLYVDAILGLILLAMGMIALWDVSFSRNTVLPQAILGAVLILTKMSGAMLLALHAALLLVLWRARRPREGTPFPHLLALLAACAAARVSFSLHVERTFGEALSQNQFQLSLSNFTAKLQEKSPEFWSQFPRVFLSSLLSRDNVSSCFFVLCNLCLLVLFLLILSRRARLSGLSKTLIVFSWASVLFYLLSLAAMYIFLMNEYEALLTASFERYFGTIMIYQVGLVFTGLLMEGGEDLFRQRAVPAWALALCLCGILLPARHTLFPPRWKVNVRLSQINAETKILSAAGQVCEALSGDQIPVFTTMDYTQVGGEYVYLILRYSFWRPYMWPFDQGYWKEEFASPGGSPCYVLWLEDDGWASSALAEAGISVPEQPGLYWKDAENQLALMEEIVY